VVWGSCQDQNRSAAGGRLARGNRVNRSTSPGAAASRSNVENCDRVDEVIVRAQVGRSSGDG
jgi:hypothetical protein